MVRVHLLSRYLDFVSFFVHEHETEHRAGLYRTSYARISRSTITDTELQIGQFVVPAYGQVVEDDSHDARYMRSFKEVLPEEHVRRFQKHSEPNLTRSFQWFPMEYYGNTTHGGVRGSRTYFADVL
jgi:hypothetical protein